jgi:mRNA interferase MazF
MTQIFKFGEIWLANLNPSHGSEPGKTRPVLIIQNQALLDVQHPSTLVIPLTTQLVEKTYPLRIRVNPEGKLEKASDLLMDQLRAIDNRRLIQGPLQRCSVDFMRQVQTAILDLIDYAPEDELDL